MELSIQTPGVLGGLTQPSVQGKCMKQVQDVVERLWDFIDKLDINTFGKFLADNIVGSVVAFSLLFWVPVSILVHFVVSHDPFPACSV